MFPEYIILLIFQVNLYKIFYNNFNDILNKYAIKGFRILALGFKTIKMSYVQSQQLTREKAESRLIFLGLLIVQNKLKEETKPTLNILEKAGLKMVMATGDNILTAISVSKECELIKKRNKAYFKYFRTSWIKNGNGHWR